MELSIYFLYNNKPFKNSEAEIGKKITSQSHQNFTDSYRRKKNVCQKALREKCPNTELVLVRIFLYSD